MEVRRARTALKLIYTGKAGLVLIGAVSYKTEGIAKGELYRTHNRILYDWVP